MAEPETETHPHPCTGCEHGVVWHEGMGCGYLGWSRERRCPCTLKFHEALDTLLAAHTTAAMLDLRERLERAEARLSERRGELSLRQRSEDVRLGGKVEGVKLALAYIEERPRG